MSYSAYSPLQNFKVDNNIDGEAVLSSGRYVPFLRDNNDTSFSKGALMWSAGRFQNVSDVLGYKEYEAMCSKLAETTSWEASRPHSEFKPGFAEFTLKKAPHSERDAQQVRRWSTSMQAS